ncbi:hypothetical protein BCR44DRAFT_1498761 [Catenaria anguillulae PL171]|uniref:Inhibitor I9 domain-containing protein n=1 Tax=Catenaria anguillulae PL171 TaxID=765915 RepID=A0A1Y2HPS0_9FUNG|nr:hypothetical protein BCR44DRAFT_1498761 [Catenaria anguillulae PL171]
MIATRSFLVALLLAIAALASLFATPTLADSPMVDLIVSYYKPGSSSSHGSAAPASTANTLTAADLASMLTSESGVGLQSRAGAFLDASTLSDAIKQAGGKVKYEYSIIDAVALSVPANVADRLKTLQRTKTGIMAVEEDSTVSAFAKVGL